MNTPPVFESSSMLARCEEDKEDLIRDATAMPERAELACTDWPAAITVGFFRDGRFSVYIDQNPFYQFDAHGRLRRAFENGRLYRSQGHTLSQITRNRSQARNGTGPVILERIDLTAEQLHDFLRRMRTQITRLRDHLTNGQVRIGRSAPQHAGLPANTLPMLNRILSHRVDALSDPPSCR